MWGRFEGDSDQYKQTSTFPLNVHQNLISTYLARVVNFVIFLLWWTKAIPRRAYKRIKSAGLLHSLLFTNKDARSPHSCPNAHRCEQNLHEVLSNSSKRHMGGVTFCFLRESSFRPVTSCRAPVQRRGRKVHVRGR